MSAPDERPVPLVIPDAAVREVAAVPGMEMCSLSMCRLLASIGAGFVVAAELRRLAEEPGMGFKTGPHDVSSAEMLRARADELDGGLR